jgi:hypothetical protein
VARLWYRARWENLTADQQIVSLPESGYMDALYLMLARAWAQGYEDADVATTSERVAEIQNGPVWSACVSRDMSEQTEYGAMDDGLAAESASDQITPFTNAVFVPFTP